MNQNEKERLNKQILDIKEQLETHFKQSVYQDYVSEDETNNNNFTYFIIEQAGFSVFSNTKKSVKQDIFITFYSENREDLTGDQLDIISLIESSTISFENSDVNHLKLDNQDRFIDQVVLNFKRLVRSGC